MRVFDVLTESKKIDSKVDEGPLRYLKRSLGKNTASGKSAQLDVEIEQEAKNIFKDFYAISKNSPNGEMTAQALSKFLVNKGFVSSPKAVMAYINADPGFSRTAAKAGKKIAKVGAVATGAVTGTVKSGASKVVGAAKALKKRVTPQDTGIGKTGTGEPIVDPSKVTVGRSKAGKFTKLAASMYSEASIMEADAVLSKGLAMKAIKKFVQQGMAANAGKGSTKSAYADNSSSTDNDKPTKSTDNSKSTKSGGKAPAKAAGNDFKVTKVSPELIAMIKKAGYSVYKDGQEV